MGISWPPNHVLSDPRKQSQVLILTQGKTPPHPLAAPVPWGFPQTPVEGGGDQKVLVCLPGYSSLGPVILCGRCLEGPPHGLGGSRERIWKRPCKPMQHTKVQDYYYEKLIRKGGNLLIISSFPFSHFLFLCPPRPSFSPSPLCFLKGEHKQGRKSPGSWIVTTERSLRVHINYTQITEKCEMKTSSAPDSRKMLHFGFTWHFVFSHGSYLQALVISLPLPNAKK